MVTGAAPISARIGAAVIERYYENSNSK